MFLLAGLKSASFQGDRARASPIICSNLASLTHIYALASHPMRSTISSGPIRLLAVALLFIGFACSREADSKSQHRDAGPAAAVPVELTTLVAGPLENVLRFSANLEAETQVQVLARTAGQVVKVLVEEGDVVERQQVLLRLEDAEQRSALKHAATTLAQAKRSYEQQQKLLSHGVISDNENSSAEFELKRLQISHNDAKRMLRYTVIRAAVGGTVTLRQVKLGDFVNPNQRLFDIADFNSIVAKVFVPEKELSAVRKDQVVRLFPPNAPELGREAIVQRVAPIVDPRTGTAKVTIRIPDTSGLKPGSFVSVELVTAENPKAVLLPRKALVYDNDEPFAFKLVAGNRVERVAVVPQLQGADYVEAKSGFAVGDQVVIAGQVGLKDKALVSTKAKAPSAAP